MRHMHGEKKALQWERLMSDEDGVGVERLKW
jgi:hypothetical protein